MVYKNKEYNGTYFDEEHLIDTKNKRKSFRHFVMEDGLILGMFQGERGDRPDLDFIIKFLEPGLKKRLRTPANMHWVVDLLLKMETNKKDVCEIIHFYNDFYIKTKPFETQKERNYYIPITPKILKKKYPQLKHKGTYSLEYVAHVIELFTICEKITPREKKMFQGLLIILSDYCEGKKDFYQVMNASKPGFGF